MFVYNIYIYIIYTYIYIYGYNIYIYKNYIYIYVDDGSNRINSPSKEQSNSYLIAQCHVKNYSSSFDWQLQVIIPLSLSLSLSLSLCLSLSLSEQTAVAFMSLKKGLSSERLNKKDLLFVLIADIIHTPLTIHSWIVYSPFFVFNLSARCRVVYSRVRGGRQQIAYLVTGSCL